MKEQRIRTNAKRLAELKEEQKNIMPLICTLIKTQPHKSIKANIKDAWSIYNELIKTQ